VVAASRVVRVAVSATRVLRASQVVSAPAPGVGGVLRYSSGSGSGSVRVGEFVAADVGPATPFGLLERVVSVRRSGGSTVLSVVPASLVEAVPEGRIDLASGAGAAAAPRSHGFRSPFDCSGAAHASLAGSLALRLTPVLRLHWSLDGIDSAEASATLRGDADLRVGLDAAASCTLPQTRVAGWDAPPLRFFAGPIPVVVVPRTTLYVAGEARASAAVEVGAHGYVSATAGLRYDGDVHPIGSFRHGFTATAPSVRLDGQVAARVIPSIEFLLYGATGPRFDFSAGLQLDASATSDPWWKLTAPVELSAGLDFPGVAELTVPQRTVLRRTLPIAQAAGDPAAGSPEPGAGPGPGPAARPERARIAWDTGSTDVDLHVWDSAGHHAWFRDPTAVPGGELSEDDRYGFGPEYFRGGAGAVTYGLCYFDDAGGGPTTVSVRLTDPDGAVRSFSRRLTHEGEGVLLGSSPPGSGFVPPAGWCSP
jgi:hypothetical protein